MPGTLSCCWHWCNGAAMGCGPVCAARLQACQRSLPLRTEMDIYVHATPPLLSRRALEAASSDSMRAVLRGNRAAASLALGQYPDTMVDCLVAAKLDPTYARVHQRLAEAHAAVGDFASAHASLCDLNR